MSHTDVCIVGMGVAGAILASELTQAGLKVLVLERGPRWSPDDFRDHDEIDHAVRQRLLHDARAVPYTLRTSDAEEAVVLPHANRGTGTGGASIIYTAIMPRLLPNDFRTLTVAQERYGEEAIPPNVSLADWPVTYDELEPYYDRAEYDLGIAGQAGVLVDSDAPGGIRRLPDGNPFEGPRRRPLPLPAPPVAAAGRIFGEAAAACGYHPYPIIAGVLSEPYRGRNACTYCGTCTMYGCHVGAKASTDVTHLPLAEATGNLALQTGCTVFRIETDPAGSRVERVRYFDQSGEAQEARAGVFILAAFTFQTPRLLFLSASDRFPTGLANRSGQVGRNYVSFGTMNGVGLLEDIELRPYVGPVSCHRTIDDFNGDNFDHTGLGFIQGANISSGYTRSSQPLSFANLIPPGLPRWGRSFKEYVQRYFTRNVVVTAVCETLPSRSSYVDLDPTVKDRWGLPALRITFNWGENERRLHAFVRDRIQEILKTMPVSRSWVEPSRIGSRTNALGTTRMGIDPATSVVDSYGRCHNVPNLFISGGATFPASGGKVPTLTIAALAYRTAEHLIAEAQNGGSMARYV